MTSHLNSHRKTDIKPEMLTGVQPENGTPHDKYNIRGIAHARKNRKDNIFMQRLLQAHMTLDIFRFVVFFFIQTMQGRLDYIWALSITCHGTYLSAWWKVNSFYSGNENVSNRLWEIFWWKANTKPDHC